MRPARRVLAGLTLAASIALLPATLTRAADYSATWTPTVPGIEIGKLSIPTVKDGMVEISAVRVDPKIHRIRVVDVQGYLHKLRYAPITVTKIDPTRDPAFKEQLSYSIGEIAFTEAPEVIINGGFKGDEAYNLPAGLLQVDGKTVGRLNTRSSIQSGIVCAEGKRFSILWRQDYVADRCPYALQSGPFIINPGNGERIGIDKDRELALPAYRRSFVCVETSGQAVFAVTTKTHLYDLAVALDKERQALKLDCAAALNLSGSVESGMIVRDDVAGGSGGPLQIGATSVSVASALAVTRRTALDDVEPQPAPPADTTPPGASQAAEKSVSKKTIESIQDMVAKAMDVVTDKKATPQQRDRALVGIVKDGFDLDYIVGFVLGRYKNRATPAQVNALTDAYATWLVRSYMYSVDELFCTSQSSDQEPEFDTRRVVRAGREGRDILVSTVLTLPRSGQTYNIGWIVNEEAENRVRVVNVEIEGVSMLISQRSEFGEILRKDGVDGLIDSLSKRAARIPLPGRCMH